MSSQLDKGHRVKGYEKKCSLQQAIKAKLPLGVRGYMGNVQLAWTSDQHDWKEVRFAKRRHPPGGTVCRG